MILMYVPFAKDTLQKLSLISFAQVMLVMMGDERQVVGFYPTELIIPTFRKKFMDAVLELDDGTLLNIEFMTGNLVEKFLLRCAQYAINLRVISGRYVETKILSTGSRAQSKSMALISKIFHFKPEIYFYSEFDGLEKLINIKNKINNQEKLTLMDRYNLVFIPLMGNVDRVKAAFEVFNIANNSDLFTEDEQSEIKRCQYIVAQIIAEGDDELLDEFWGLMKMNNTFLARYEQDLVDQTTREVTEQVTERVTEKVSINIARNFKDCLPDEEIAERTGLSLEEVQKL